MVFLHQQHIVDEIIAIAEIEGKTSLSTPANPNVKLEKGGEIRIDETKYQSAIGKLLWLARCTRPDIMFQVIALAQFQSEPFQRHWGAIQHVARYLQGSSEYGIVLNATNMMEFTAYVDAGHHNPNLQLRSVNGAVIYLGGLPISWTSSIQKSRTISTTESEYIAISEGMRTIMWLSDLLNEVLIAMGEPETVLPMVYNDCNPALDAI